MKNTNQKSFASRRLAHAGLVLGLFALAGCHSSQSPSDSSASACAGADAWPKSALTAADASTANATEFISEAQLKSWQADLDGLGLRATGDEAHEKNIDTLVARLKCVGATDVHTESVPLDHQWLVDHWSLSVDSGPSAGPVTVASYAPYSGVTSENGISASTVYLDANTTATAANAAGKIVLFDEPTSSLPVAGFALYGMGLYNITAELTKMYSRPYLAQGALIEKLDEVKAAGASGAIVISPLPYDGAFGSYYPYDYILRGTPTLFVDKNVGTSLKTLAASATPMTIKLPAKVKAATTRNIIAYIPGASDELTVIHSHTDGTNGIEDNGPIAILGIAQYLARLPKSELPRSVMIMLSAGHFTGGSGIQHFLKVHADDGLLSRIASITTIEHLGAQEWEPDSSGKLVYTGKPELGALFAPQIQALADASCDWFINANAGPGAVLKPLNAGGDGTANDAVWPGEGQYFYGIAHIPTVNYITGPNYLLNWGVDTVAKTDFDRMRRQTVAFAQMQLDLSRVPKANLAIEGTGVATLGSGKYLSKGVCVPTPIPVTVPLP